MTVSKDQGAEEAFMGYVCQERSITSVFESFCSPVRACDLDSPPTRSSFQCNICPFTLFTTHDSRIFRLDRPLRKDDTHMSKRDPVSPRKPRAPRLEHGTCRFSFTHREGRARKLMVSGVSKSTMMRTPGLAARMCWYTKTVAASRV